MISVLIFSIFFYFPQKQIDKILSGINSLSINSDSILSPIESTLKMFTQRPLALNHNNFDLKIDTDIIIGDTPGETLSVYGYFYNSGNIIIINDGVLRVKNATFSLAGNIYVLNKGKALADSSSLRFLQNYIYQYGITLIDPAEFVLTNSNVRYNGYPFGFLAGEFANVVIKNTINYDWTTAMVSGRANVYLNNVCITGEWLFSENCFAHLDQIQILPNPFNDCFIIKYYDDKKDPPEYILYDITGRVLQKQKYGGKIDTALLPQGVYFVCLENGRYRIIKKVVKIKY